MIKTKREWKNGVSLKLLSSEFAPTGVAVMVLTFTRGEDLAKYEIRSLNSEKTMLYPIVFRPYRKI